MILRRRRRRGRRRRLVHSGGRRSKSQERRISRAPRASTPSKSSPLSCGIMNRKRRRLFDGRPAAADVHRQKPA
jgi:hypothetical protein